MASSETGDLHWVHEAIQNATSTANGQPNYTTDGREVKPDNKQSCYVPVIETGPAVNAKARQQVKAWTEAWQLLSKHEQSSTADIHQTHEELAKLLGGPAALLRDAPDPDEVRQERSRTWSSLRRIREAVQNVNEKLNNVKTSPSYVAELAASIDIVDQLMADFKKWQASIAAALAQQQASLEDDIDAIALRIEEEMMAGPGPGSLAAAAGHTDISSAPASRRGSREAWLAAPKRPQSARSAGGGHVSARAAASRPTGARGGALAPEVVEFEEFVAATGGDTGGWDPEDHAEFVRILKACGGDYTHAVEVVLERCVGYKKSEIVAHARWHMDYMDLLIRKRMAVAAWRARRDQQRGKACAQAALYENPSAEEAVAEHVATSRQRTEKEREHAVAKELVQNWKERKEAAERRAAQEAARRAQEERERELIQRSERQHLNKLKLAFHKEVKDRVEAELRRRQVAAEQERRSLQVLTPDQAAAVAQRSAAAAARRQELLAAKQAAAKKREEVQSKLLEKVHVEAPADPSRLLRGTAAHMRRVEENRQEQRQPRDSAFILHTTGLAVPSWRAGL